MEAIRRASGDLLMITDAHAWLACLTAASTAALRVPGADLRPETTPSINWP